MGTSNVIERVYPQERYSSTFGENTSFQERFEYFEDLYDSWEYEFQMTTPRLDIRTMATRMADIGYDIKFDYAVKYPVAKFCDETCRAMFVMIYRGTHD